MKMKFKNKKLETEFFEWYAKKINFIGIPEIPIDVVKQAKNRYNELTQAEQFGSFQEFCDTKGINVEAWDGYGGWEIGGKLRNHESELSNKPRSEAQIEAFNKVNEIWE